MMFALRVAAVVISLGCLVSCAESDPADVPAPVEDSLAGLPVVEDGKFDSAKSLQKTELLQAIKDRLQEVRRYKANGTLGENARGLVEVPELAEVQTVHEAEGTDYTVAQAAVVQAENADRAAYYDLIMATHEADIERQIEEQKPELRAQVVQQLCDELPAGEICESIADTVIKTALDEALAVATAAAVAEVRAQVEIVHAQFWQDRVTKSGEWIQIPTTTPAEWSRKP